MCYYGDTVELSQF